MGGPDMWENARPYRCPLYVQYKGCCEKPKDRGDGMCYGSPVGGPLDWHFYQEGKNTAGTQHFKYWRTVEDFKEVENLIEWPTRTRKEREELVERFPVLEKDNSKVPTPTSPAECAVGIPDRWYSWKVSYCIRYRCQTEEDCSKVCNKVRIPKRKPTPLWETRTLYRRCVDGKWDEHGWRQKGDPNCPTPTELGYARRWKDRP